MAIRAETLRLVRELRRAVGGPADDATRALAKAWLRAWEQLDGQFTAALEEILRDAARTGQWPRPWELARVDRLRNALAEAEDRLNELAGQVRTETSDAATSAVKATIEAEPRVMASQLPAAERAAAATAWAARIPPNALDVIVARTTQQITALTRPLSASASAAMQRELVRGVAIGANPKQAARRMVLHVQGAFNGGLTRAMTIARTETLDAYRVASKAAHTANRDVVAGWTWLATLDKRTCPACWSQHGTEHPVDELGPLDHQQGRCARVPIIRPWSELGIKMPEPASTIPDARARFDALPEEDQLAVMGPARLELLKSGRIGWDDLATRRTTAGWRDSYTPTPVNVLQRSTR